MAALIVCLLDRRVVWHNRQAQAAADRHSGRLLGAPVEELSEDPHRPLVREAIDRIEHADSGFQRFSVACGAERCLEEQEVTCLVLDANTHEAPHAVVYSRTVASAPRWQGPNAEQLNALADPVNGGDLAALLTDGSGLVLSVTQASCALFGLPAESLRGHRLSEFLEDHETVEELLRCIHERPSRPVSAWLTIRDQVPAEHTPTGAGRRVAMSVSSRFADPPLGGLLWHKLPIDDPPINAPREGYSSEYAAFLERRLAQIGREVERAGLAVRTTKAVPARVLAGLERLSDREREVLDLLARGLRVPTIAERLFVSQSTVRNHVSALFRKLGVQSQAELIERILSPEGGDEGS